MNVPKILYAQEEILFWSILVTGDHPMFQQTFMNVTLWAHSAKEDKNRTVRRAIVVQYAKSA